MSICPNLILCDLCFKWFDADNWSALDYHLDAWCMEPSRVKGNIRLPIPSFKLDDEKVDKSEGS